MKRLQPPRYGITAKITPEELENNPFLDSFREQSSLSQEELERLTSGAFMVQAHDPNQKDYDQIREYTF